MVVVVVVGGGGGENLSLYFDSLKAKVDIAVKICKYIFMHCSAYSDEISLPRSEWYHVLPVSVKNKGIAGNANSKYSFEDGTNGVSPRDPEWKWLSNLYPLLFY